jgi:phage terminase large subunit-like protein
VICFKPQKGPQTQFAQSRADIALYSGEVGSGKTFALVSELGRWSHVKSYVGAGFRREYKQLVGGGSLWDVATKTWPKIDSRVRMPEHRAVWPSSASVEFHHLHLESDKTDHDGKEYALLALDELAHFSESQFWYMLMRNRSTCGVTPYVRATCMASPDTWLHEFVKPWLIEDRYPDHAQSGKLRYMIRDERDVVMWFDSLKDAREYDPDAMPLSVTVIHARTKDNAELLARDPAYLAKLSSLTKLEKATKGRGDWGARPESAGMFERGWFKVRESVPTEMIRFSVRGWDKAATKRTVGTGAYSDDPDWTAGVRLDVLRNGEVVVSDIVAIQERPDRVDALYEHVALVDGPKVTQAFWLDPAQAGLVDEAHTRAVLARVRGCGPVKFEKASKKVATFAAPIASYAGPDTPGGMSVVRATWNGPFFAELEQFPAEKDVFGNKIHDDRVSAMARAWLEAKSYLKLERAGSPGQGWADKMRTSRL